MKSPSWFPDEEVPIKPVADRTTPPLWVRRVVVVEERRPDSAVIRDVSFRPGLNVIRVAGRPPGEIRSVGHSVGKTLLARLIRYCLGERYFAKDSVLDHIKRALPKAYVLAEVEISGTTWVVSRPVGNTATGESYVVPAENWHAGLDEARGLRPFGGFQHSLAEAILSAMPNLELPDAGRPARWLDLLAWLARDQECSYRHSNEWRDPDANSGTARLHRDDASLLLSWAMGFLDSDASTKVSGHRTLLSEQTQARAEFERQAARLEFTKDSLRARLTLEAVDEPEEFFLQKARQKVRKTIESLQSLQAEFAEDGVAALLHAEVVRLAGALGGVQNELDRVRALRQHTQGELTTVRQSSDEQFYAKFFPGPTCPLARHDCPVGPRSSITSAEDPRREARIVELETLVTHYDEDVSRLEERLDRLGLEQAQAESRYAEVAKDRSAKHAGIQSKIARWLELGDEVERYECDRNANLRVQVRCERLALDIQESRGLQEAARDQKKKSLHNLSQYFDRALKGLFGPDAGGRVRLDGRGLHPEPGATLGVNGAAVSALSTVLGFDLACLTAATCGLGHAPPFLIHDSPKEADMEDALYDRLFELPLELERAYRGQTPLFQYIVTTTSPPPAIVAHEPYTRLILDARVQEGFLLGRRF